MKTKKLNKKYNSKELSDAFVFRNTLSNEETQKARKQLAEARQKLKISNKDVTLAKVLQLRYQMEDYINSSKFDENINFASFLRTYIKLSYSFNKDFAKDIHLNITELSQILKQHRNPSENTIIRLELHSNNIISAVNWYKLLEKSKLHELENNRVLREKEEKYVKRRLAL